MALTDNGSGSDMVMPVAPMYGGGYGGFGGFGGDGWWVILFLFALMGNWGGGFGGGFGGGNSIWPYFTAQNTDNGVQRGFDTAALTGQLSGIQNAITGGFANAEVANCNRAIDNLQQTFATQTAITNGLNGVQAQLAQCCCDNRAAIADLRYTVATEACADRAAVNDALRDVLAANTASTQRILDQMCADKIDAKNEKIADLERQLSMTQLAASQTAQTAAIQRGQTAEVDALYQRLRDCPVPTMPVYGMQPIFTCGGNNTCGCGFNSVA